MIQKRVKSGLIFLACFCLFSSVVMALEFQVQEEEKTPSGVITSESSEKPGESTTEPKLTVVDPWVVSEQRYTDRLVISNGYIAVAVNTTNDATGRFGVKVTGGDPYRIGDEEQPLIYGFELPWTSYTTVRIDGKNYIFGGKTKKRSGGTGQYGKIISAPTFNKEKMTITMTCRFGEIDVTQELEIVESTTTGMADTAKLKYQVINRGETPHEVGIRVVVDTMLGENDGAPFRIGETSILTDQVFEKSALPEFWQAFDTLSNPRVIAQGTLKGREATPPDFLYFTNWGTVADSHWEVPLVAGRDFTRAGEFDLDSAAVYLWKTETVYPSEGAVYLLYYGLGGVTVMPGELQLGISSPAEITLSETEKTYSLIAYIENTGETPALNTRVRLNIPLNGLTLVGERPADVILGNLQPGKMAQIHWEVKPTGRMLGLLQFEVVVTAGNVPENRGRRNIKVVGPPKLALRVNPPAPIKVVDEKITPMPYPIEAVITNTGESTAYGVIGHLQLGQGMEPAPNELIQKYIGNLKPREEYKLSWYLIPDGIGVQTYLGVRFESTSTKPVLYIAGIRLPVLTPKIRLVPLGDKHRPGEILAIEVRAEHFSALNGARFGIKYDPNQLEPMRISRGLFFIENSSLIPWDEGIIKHHLGEIKGIGGTRRSSAPSGVSLATIHFKLGNKPGEALIGLEEIILRSNDGRIPLYKVEGLKIIITNEGGVKIETYKMD